MIRELAPMICKLSIVVASGLVLGLGSAQAQDLTATPSFGTAKLASGFRPDPHIVEMIAGGDLDVGATIGGSCVGFLAEAPDFRLHYTAGPNPLIFFVESAGDTTLVISDPDGNWICNDDSGQSFDPRVIIENPISGQYNIWVGTFFAGELEEATLFVSEILPEPALDWSLPANFGEFDLTAGFKPDPFAIDLVAGGEGDARTVSSECWGFATAAPDIRIYYTAGFFPLFISVESSTDTTLIISDPSGNWICDDDSGPGLNPEIFIEAPQSGQYDIWVGTYSAGETADATLYVSEVSGLAAASLDWDLEPNFGETDLATGFLPDPFVLEMLAGGDVEASIAGEGCRGFCPASAPLGQIGRIEQERVSGSS